MPSRRSHGLTTPLASLGKHSSPQAKAPITATAAASVKHVLRTPNHAAASDCASINRVRVDVRARDATLAARILAFVAVAFLHRLLGAIRFRSGFYLGQCSPTAAII